MARVLLGFESQHGAVFGKIHPALLTLPSRFLNILAGGAFVAKRSVAA